MTTRRSPNLCQAPLYLTAPILVCLPSAMAIDIIENFDGSELDSVVWEATGPKTKTVDSGLLTFNDDGGDWGSGDISTAQRFLLPPEGEITTVTWTLGPASITTENPANDGNTVRYQIGLHSANETNLRREHWLNTTGGIWIDLDIMSPTDTTMASGKVLFADDTKASATLANELNEITIPWNWLTEDKVLRLEFTNLEYTWYDGATSLGTGTWADANIDTEFDDGFRVLALGMNFSEGRASTSINKIEITNAAEPTSLLSSFQSDLFSAVSGQPLSFSWLVDKDATVSIDQGIGDVTDSTINGVGSLSTIAPDIEFANTLQYTLTVTKGVETDTRTIDLLVEPAPELSLESFSEEFDGDSLDFDFWEHRGNQTFTVADGQITWSDDGSNWSHGEVDTVKAFPIPPAGKPTTITWMLGPNSVTVDNGDGTAIRPIIGIFSAFETQPWSRQPWQNTTGGTWLDIRNMGESRTDGASGNLHYATDQKIFETDAETIAAIDIPDWNWQTEAHEFSLVLTDIGFTWFNGTEELGSGVYADLGLDTEFSRGFKVMSMAGNLNAGRGIMSLESISLENGATIPPPELIVTSFEVDRTAETVDLTWTATPDTDYSIQRLSVEGMWETIEDDVASIGETGSFTLTGVTADKAIYRIIEQ